MKIFKILISTYLLVSIMTGCVAYNALPIAARPGDTVALAIGSADGITEANTTVTYSPAGGGSVSLTDFSIFKLYPDKTSPTVANPGNSYWQLTTSSGHEPWLTIMAINLPTGIPVGNGFINISTTADYPTISSHVNDVPIALEILPEDSGVGATGSPHPLEYSIGLGDSKIGNLSTLERAHQVIVKPPFSESAVWPSYGAIELTLRFAADGAPPANFQLVPDDIALFTGSDRNIIHRVSGDELIVSYISPTGLLSYYEPRFSVVPLQARAISAPPPASMPSAPPTVESVVYYDIDGAIVDGPDATQYSVLME